MIKGIAEFFSGLYNVLYDIWHPTSSSDVAELVIMLAIVLVVLFSVGDSKYGMLRTFRRSICFLIAIWQFSQGGILLAIIFTYLTFR